MPSPAAPRVFISYSNQDAEIVGRVRTALADAGVAVWLDHEQLAPGTPDWRAAVLRGKAGNIDEWTNSLYLPYPVAPTDGQADLDSQDVEHTAAAHGVTSPGTRVPRAEARPTQT